MSSLAASAEEKIFEELSRQVASENTKSLFGIGGAIPVTALDGRLICESDEARSDGHQSTDEVNTADTEVWEISSDGDNSKPDVHRMRCDPVTIRWDSDENIGCRVTLPCADANRPEFEQLLKDCQPASFGRGGKDVMDESYRKAGKMDESVFCSNFNPYALGIIDTVAQALTPNLAHQTNETHGLRAELYKLNVYSGPSGKFKAHVDTPRSKHQIGSLVVCLPSVHNGGQLVLRHQGREQVFDWSGGKGRNTIQWAAFYSDCEHEVLEVTSGHRVTLTYNLYATCWANTAWLDPEQLDLYRTLKRLSTEPGFCKDGVILGYHCAHAYPHTEKDTINTLPATLKGVDKVVYECFFATNFCVSLRHSLDLHIDHDAIGFGDEPIESILGINSEYDLGQPPQHLESMFEKGTNYVDNLTWRIKADSSRRGNLAVLTDKLEPLRFSDAGISEHLTYREIIDEWSSKYEIECVRWLNWQSSPQPALLHGAYGNQPETTIKYANLVITMVVPPFHMR